MAGRSDSVPVFLEVGGKRVFACALDWPGWCRSGKDEQAALAALAAYLPRYAPVATLAGLPFVPDDARLEVLERLPGSATTDFGAPDAFATRDHDRVDPATGRRLAALVGAAWRLLAEVAAGTPEELRKGPRGGGRDRTAMLEHVEQAEFSYARKVGVRHRAPQPGDVAALVAMRADLLAVIAAGRPAEPVQGKEWPIRYAARRVAWHVLDHAWEMTDRRLLG